MKYFIGLLVAFATTLGVFAGSANANANQTATITGNSSAKDRIVLSEARYIPTKSKKKRKKKKKKSKKGKKQSIKSIRDNAIKDTLRGIRALRPYATNYNRLKSAVRRYWKSNVTRPSTNGLTNTIMRYVKRKNRKLVRSEVRSGSKSGVNKVKKALKKRK